MIYVCVCVCVYAAIVVVFHSVPDVTDTELRDLPADGLLRCLMGKKRSRSQKRSDNFVEATNFSPVFILYKRSYHAVTLLKPPL